MISYTNTLEQQPNVNIKKLKICEKVTARVKVKSFRVFRVRVLGYGF